MTKYFTFTDGSSNKFWEIDIQIDENEGKYGFVTTYGKIGTDGQTSKKSFDSAEQCQKEADKIIAQKVKEGYVEGSKARYAVGFDDKKGTEDLVKQILDDPKLPTITYINIGMWASEIWDEDCQPIIDMFVENPEKFAKVDTLFIGDMDSEENEISWILQGNYSKLFKAMPQLKTLKIKGSNGLVLGKIEHENLTHFEIICGGLSSSVLKELSQAKLPNLETLILYLGVENYGFDATIEDVIPLLSKKLFPKVRTLGIVNSEIQDEVAIAMMASDILPQLEELQLCYGALSNDGGQALLDNAAKIAHLKLLDLEHHFLTDDMMKKLKKLPIKINLFDANEEEEYDGDVYRWVVYSE